MKLTIKVNKTDTDKFELVGTKPKINGAWKTPALIAIIDRSAFAGTQLDNDIEETLDYQEEVEIEMKVVK